MTLQPRLPAKLATLVERQAPAKPPEDEAEFFAAATESFFERGAYLKRHHPRLETGRDWRRKGRPSF